MPLGFPARKRNSSWRKLLGQKMSLNCWSKLKHILYAIEIEKDRTTLEYSATECNFHTLSFQLLYFVLLIGRKLYLNRIWKYLSWLTIFIKCSIYGFKCIDFLPYELIALIFIFFELKFYKHWRDLGLLIQSADTWFTLYSNSLYTHQFQGFK